LRQEAIKEAERDRRIKYKKQEDAREDVRAGIREKVRIAIKFLELRLQKSASFSHKPDFSSNRMY
jgi:hypothetical protein